MSMFSMLFMEETCDFLLLSNREWKEYNLNYI